jgi:hypothetical protein
MKKLLVLSVLLLNAAIAFAQTSKEDAAIIRAVFNKEKKEIVQQYMALSGPTSDAFYAVYDEYEVKRMDLSAERLAVLSDYAEHYDSLTDEKAADLAKRLLSNDKSINCLQKKYFKKMAKAAGARNATKFLQLDAYMQSAIRMQIQDSIPFIDELGNTKTK